MMEADRVADCAGSVRPPVIAALFVAKGGAYFGLPDVDPWDEARDARLYAGSWPVVAHPPCQRWGRYWHGGPSSRTRLVKGDDGGCFASAIESVRRWGGVLEHPEASGAWQAFGLLDPPKYGGWVPAGDWRGWTCCVEQGHYGHRARKATWLYAVSCELSALKWGSAGNKARLDEGFHSAEERRAFRSNRPLSPALMAAKRLSSGERLSTPLPFRDVLIAMARSVRLTSIEQRGLMG